MKKIIPIDKSKKSNRRCWNCKHWAKKRTYGATIWMPTFWCDTSGRAMEYWNCCKHFEWNTDKVYKDDDKDGQF